MKTTVVKLCLFGLLLAIGAVVPWQIWRRPQFQMRAKNEDLQRQLAEYAGLATENARLSNLFAQAAKDSPSAEQFHELLRLRGEIGTLRRMAAEIEQLRARNERAQAELAKSATPIPLDSQKIQAHWPKDQLALAGYADPASAVQTTLWAITHSDPNTLAAGVTPKALAELTREQWYDHRLPAEELADATQKIADSLKTDIEFDVLGQDFPAQDQATVEVYFGGEGQTRKFFMRRITGEWKFDSLGQAWP